jgi:selenocysteine-specific elongation factor
MRAALVGVIGHVDHGKTSLVRALTGIETDRLTEEQARGLSIALGFAHLAVEGGVIDLIDMPGHERFLRTMVAGATGMDAVLLVVAANEGIRPQTKEHLTVARLLGVRRGVIAITKTDRVSPEAARRAGERVEAYVAQRGWPGMPVVLTSAHTGAGLAELTCRIGALARPADPTGYRGFAWLPIDRVFAIAGFGTVVTGTLRFGRLGVGEEIEIGSVTGAKHTARIRGLHVHGRVEREVAPGRRVAVNLREPSHRELGRGDVLATPGMLSPSSLIDALISVVANHRRPLRTGASVRLLAGTAETIARIRLLDRDQLQPGESAPAQLALERRLHHCAGEPFILRQGSPPVTIGGGLVLQAQTRRRRRFDEEQIERFRRLASANAEAIIAGEIETAGLAGVMLPDLARLVGLSPGLTRTRLPRAACVLEDGRVMGQELLSGLEQRIEAALIAHQRAQPLDPRVSSSRLEAITAPAAPAAMRMALDTLRSTGRAALELGGWRAARDPSLPLEAAAALAQLEAIFRRAGLSPPSPAEPRMAHPGNVEIIRRLLRRDRLVRTFDRVQKREILFHKEAVELAIRKLEAELGGEEGFLVGDAGRVLGISRKYSIPLLEHLDGIGATRRRGDRRFVTRRPAALGETAA